MVIGNESMVILEPRNVPADNDPGLRIVFVGTGFDIAFVGDGAATMVRPFAGSAELVTGCRR